MKQTRKLSDGTFAVSEGGSWVTGRYESEKAALLACDKEPDALKALWESCLASGRETLTFAEVEVLP